VNKKQKKKPHPHRPPKATPQPTHKQTHLSQKNPTSPPTNLWNQNITRISGLLLRNGSHTNRQKAIQVVKCLFFKHRAEITVAISTQHCFPHVLGHAVSQPPADSDLEMAADVT